MQPMGQGGVPLSRVVETLGDDAVEVVAAPHGRAVPVSGPRLYDADDPSTLAPGDLVLGVNAGDPAVLLKDAAAAGAAAVALRAPGDHDWSDADVAVLALSHDVTWDQVLSVVHTLSLTPAGDDAEAPVRDLYSLANAIAALVGGAVSIEDPASTLLAYSTLDQPIDDARRQTILGRGHGSRWAERLREIGTFRPLVAAPGRVMRVVDPAGEARSRLAASVGAGGELLGFIWVVEGETPFTEADEQALRGTLPLAALHLLRHRSAHDVTRRERGLLLRQALLGEAPPDVLGLSGSCAVAAFRLEVLEEADLTAHRTRAVDLITLAAEAFRRRVVCAWVDDTVYALFPAVDGSAVDRLVALCRSTAEQARTTLGVPVVVGVGGVHPLASLRVSRDEADRTVRVLRTRELVAGHVQDFQVETAVVAATDLLRGRTDVMLPCLVELEDLDRRSGGDLMPTLRALVLTGGNPPAAAEELGVHANTVRYRRTRIEDTTGLDLTDPETLFAVSLHLRAAATTEEATA
jgi:hypothetical protein